MQGWLHALLHGFKGAGLQALEPSAKTCLKMPEVQHLQVTDIVTDALLKYTELIKPLRLD